MLAQLAELSPYAVESGIARSKTANKTFACNTLLLPPIITTLLTKTAYYKLNQETKPQKPNQLSREPEFSR